MEKKKNNNTALVVVLIIVAILLVFVPFFALPGAEFGGSDDAGSEMVNEVTETEYEPWFEPILETIIGGEIPGEVESLFFCIQTGIGVGILAYGFGYFVARKKYSANNDEETPGASVE